MPKLSLITINYNNAIGLQKTIESVFAQTFNDFEYIIIDGGSTDGSKEIIEEYSGKLAYWVSEKDKGVYNAMNKGIVKANGEYLLFLNSGDYFESNDVCRFMLDNEPSALMIIYGNVDAVFPDGRSLIFEAPEKLTIPFMIAGSLFHPATFIHRSLFNEFGLYDEQLKIVSDWSFIFKAVATGVFNTKFKNITVAKFFKDGLSSKPENASLIKEERQKVVDSILPEAVKMLLNENENLKNENAFLNSLFSSRKRVIKYLLTGFSRNKPKLNS